MTLLHENGYKALAATNNSDDLRLVMTELQRKVVRVGEGDLNVTGRLFQSQQRNRRPRA
jgi:hypothetical protein